MAAALIGSVDILLVDDNPRNLDALSAILEPEDYRLARAQSAQEALASGVPVVAPRAGGPIDVVDDTVTGYLYEPGDAAELVAHVEHLLTQPVRRQRMAQAARRSVRDRTWQAVNELLVSHYRDVTSPVVSGRRAG